MSDFTNYFNPFRRDILYGLQASRETYVFAFITEEYRGLSQEQKDHYRSLEGAETFPDDFASETYNHLEDAGIYVNSYNEPITSADFRNLDAIVLGKPKSGFIDDYQSSLENTKYAVQKIGAATLRSLSKGDSKLLELTGKDKIPAKDVANLARHLAVRRACKHGIHYILSQTNAVVHYVLDDIDIQSVVDKTSYEVMDGASGVPITTTELRFMFRYWHQLREKAEEGKIIFYLNQKRAKAPWEKSPDLWLPYARHRLNKIVNVNPKPTTPDYIKIAQAALKFEQHVQAGSPGRALKTFFSVATSSSIDVDM
jgi:hypothetical protein